MRRPGTRAIVVVAVIAAAAVAARIAAPSHATRFHASRACGVERWAVKTLQDRPRLLRVRATTIAHLDSIPRPAHVPSTRLPIERRIYSVVASAEMIREESDQDLHVVLRSGLKHLIAEAPNAPYCTPKATAIRKKQMRQARSRVRSFCSKARVVGVAFFDYYHGQTGVAPNVIELHPILGYSCLRGGGPPPPPPPPPGGKCAASYPDECIPPPPPDLDCSDIPIGTSACSGTWPIPTRITSMGIATGSPARARPSNSTSGR
jgi:hypothetical protein